MLTPQQSIACADEPARRAGSRASAAIWIRAQLRRPAALAVIDQAIVSGASFLTTVLIGRYGHAEHLGIYSLGWSIVLGVLAMQMSLITAPFAVQHHQADINSRTYAGSTLLMQLALMLAVLVALLAACVFVSPALRPLVWAMCAATPFLLLREFARRMAYARLSIAAALAIDGPVVVVQIAALSLLAAKGALSAPAAFVALGAAAAVGAVITAVELRRHVTVQTSSLPADARRSWRFGRWLAGAQLLGVVNTQGTFWLIAFVIGASATGIYAACLAIVLLCNPFMLAVGNLLTPRAAETLARQGYAAMVRLILRAALILAAVMGLLCIGLAIGGDAIVRLIYGAEYAGHALLIVLLALTFLVSAVGMAINDGIRALGRADIEFAAALLDTLLTIGLGAVGLLMFGLVGLGWASLIGSIAALVLEWIAFVKLGRVARAPAGAS